MAAHVTIGACQGCGACLLTCPVHAIRPVGGTLTVLEDLCTGCGECIEICPVDVIEFTEFNQFTQFTEFTEFNQQTEEGDP